MKRSEEASLRGKISKPTAADLPPSSQTYRGFCVFFEEEDFQPSLRRTSKPGTETEDSVGTDASTELELSLRYRNILRPDAKLSWGASKKFRLNG